MDLLHEQIHVDEVIKIVAKIDTTKSAALENINSKIIKDTFLAMPDTLVKILNMSRTHAHFPWAWKLGMVVPIPKKIGSLCVEDLRPISLLPLPGKIMERVMSLRLNSFLRRNNILTDHQHGFRLGRSTISATTDFINDVFSSITIGNLFMPYFSI